MSSSQLKPELSEASRSLRDPTNPSVLCKSVWLIHVRLCGLEFPARGFFQQYKPEQGKSTRMGTLHVAPASVENATNVLGCCSGAVNHAMATVSPEADRDGPLTGHPG